MENGNNLRDAVLQPTQDMVFFFEELLTEVDFKFRLTDLLVNPYEYLDSTELRFLVSSAMIRSVEGFMDKKSYQFQAFEHFGLQDPIFVRFNRGKQIFYISKYIVHSKLF